MTYTIQIGWWLVPLLVTIITIIIAWRNCKYPKPSSSFFLDVFTPVMNIVYCGIALIISLIAWLIWALLN